VTGMEMSNKKRVSRMLAGRAFSALARRDANQNDASNPNAGSVGNMLIPERVAGVLS
jgi:hypothetical protein